MRIGVDASNLREGGGVTHLIEMLGALDCEAAGIAKLTVWGSRSILDLIKHAPRVELRPIRVQTQLRQFLWQARELGAEAARAADILFVPGGTYLGGFRPFVTMSRTLLPFDKSECREYGLSARRLRLEVLRRLQSATMRRAQSVIFLTEFAKRAVLARIGPVAGSVAVVPHGVRPFAQTERTQLPVSAFTVDRPFRLVYVSVVNTYKHQWHVVEAVARLRAEGIPVSLDLIGSAYEPSLRRLREAMRQHDPQERFVSYHGSLPHAEVSAFYQQVDGAILASSCETFGQPLLEAMGAGLPIACSNRSSLPETLGPAGEYFDPEDVSSIAAALDTLIRDSGLRARYSGIARQRASAYTWSRCAADTFSIIRHAHRAALLHQTGR